MLTVAELKQFAYCPRIFYFMAVQPLRPPSTLLMDRGHQLQAEFERLEPRRLLSRYNLEAAERRFAVHLSDSELKLSGQADLLLVATDILAVVEFKASSAPLAQNHRYQIAAYALLAERVFNKPCPRGFAVFVDRSEMEEIAVCEDLRTDTLGRLQEMRSLLQVQDFPSPTPVRGRCENCEYRNFCGDIFL